MEFKSNPLLRGLYIVAATAGLVAGAVFLSPGAIAQTTPAAPAGETAQTAPIGSWVKLCNTEEGTEVEICVISQELRDSNTAQLIASVTVREIPDQPAVLIIAVPTGVLLPPGMRVQIDQAEAKPAEYAICFPNACIARMEIDEEFIHAMKAGGQLGIAVMGGDRQQVGFPVSLVGFTKAYDGEATEQSEYEQTQRQLADIIRERAEAARAAQETSGDTPATPAPSE
jgi:invasion protein IalB